MGSDLSIQKPVELPVAFTPEKLSLAISDFFVSTSKRKLTIKEHDTDAEKGGSYTEYAYGVPTVAALCEHLGILEREFLVLTQNQTTGRICEMALLKIERELEERAMVRSVEGNFASKYLAKTFPAWRKVVTFAGNEREKNTAQTVFTGPVQIIMRPMQPRGIDRKNTTPLEIGRDESILPPIDLSLGILENES